MYFPREQQKCLVKVLITDGQVSKHQVENLVKFLHDSTFAKHFLDGLLGTLGCGNVHELVQRVDDVCAYKSVASETSAVHDTNGQGWTVEFIVRQVLERLIKRMDRGTYNFIYK